MAWEYYTPHSSGPKEQVRWWALDESREYQILDRIVLVPAEYDEDGSYDTRD